MNNRESLYQRIKHMIKQLGNGLYERQEALRLTVLAALAGKSIFFLGPPGTAKSLVARRIAQAFHDARYFEYLMGRFSTPDEIFGPVSISLLKKEDKYSRNIKGFLPDADIVFLDEIWKAGPPIQNTLLNALNERVFINGDESIHIPLKCFIAASNEIGSSKESRAFWDRFLIRLPIAPISKEESFFAMLEDSTELVRLDASLAGNSDSKEISGTIEQISTKEWQSWMGEISSISLDSDLKKVLAECRRVLQGRAREDENFYVSDRRWKHCAELARASAYFHARDSANLLDAYALVYCLWNEEEQLGEVKEMWETAVADWAFDEIGCYDRLSQASEDLQEKIQEASTFESEELVSTPARFDGEYAKIVFEGSPDEREYRIWIDDLEDMEDRGEIELFVHERGSFSHTEIHNMHWTEDEKWTMEGDLGQGKIICEEIRQKVRRAHPLEKHEVETWSNSCRELKMEIESAISSVEKQFNEYKKEAKDHLFTPRSSVTAFERARDKKCAILQDLLAGILELQESLLHAS